MSLQDSYKDVLDVAKTVGAQVESREENGKLIIKGKANYAFDRDRIWDQIKAKHANWQNEVMVMLDVANNEPYGVYTVKAHTDSGP